MSVSNVKARWASGNLSFQKDVAAAQVHFGVDDTGMDVKFFGATASSYMLWDESADALVFDAADIKMGDSDVIAFGDASDATLTWDGTTLILATLADDKVFEIGDAAATQVSWDVKIYGNAAAGADYLSWDASASQLTTVGAAYIGGRTDANGIGLAAGIKATTGDPGSTGTPTGSIVFNSNDNELLVYTGAAWIGAALS